MKYILKLLNAELKQLKVKKSFGSLAFQNLLVSNPDEVEASNWKFWNAWSLIRHGLMDTRRKSDTSEKEMVSQLHDSF